MKKLCVILLTVFAAQAAEANVSLKNGNFFIGYTDLIYSGGFEPKVERVYNSKTAHNGMFGHGWGNEYEVYLSVGPDGSVTVHEYGGGAENRFTPVGFKGDDVKAAVEKIAAAAKKVGGIGSNDQLDGYKKRLLSDASFRNEEWEKYHKQGKLEAKTLADGTQLQSVQFNYQYITKVKSGYVRSFESGKSEFFDARGHLSKISDKNNNYINLTYSQDGKLQKIVDNFNRKIFFTFNNKGKVEKIQGDDGKEATYKYNDEGELAYSKDVDGNVYNHKYSSDHFHNMTEIAYADKTALQIAYYDRDKFQNVKSIKDRDGSMTSYEYSMDKSAGRTAVSVKVVSADKKLISESRYEYYTKSKGDGEPWTYKMIAVIDGDKTETVYNESAGLPVSIKKGDEEVSFDYDAKGRVTKKVASNEVTELTYDKNAGKVSRVVRYPKSSPKQSVWSDFQYDDKGNLLTAKNSASKAVRLFYDTNGRIKSMVDQDKKRIDFKYNEHSKPVEIIYQSLGSITVTYGSNGDIKKVESSAGRKIALQVTSAFQNLLEIIKPAGVNLSF